MVFVWPAVAIAVVGILGGVTVSVVRGLRAWRDVKRFSGAVGDRVGEIEKATAEIETHLSRADESSGRLTVALENLRRSRAQLDVLLGALKEARVTVERELPFLDAL